MGEAKAVEAPTAFARLIEEYLAACRARGLAIRTVRDAYRYPLVEVFLLFCSEEGIEEPGGHEADARPPHDTSSLRGREEGRVVQVHGRQLRAGDQRLPELGSSRGRGRRRREGPGSQAPAPASGGAEPRGD